MTKGSCIVYGDNKGLFWANGGSMGATGGCMRADRVCLGYSKPGRGYWAAKTGQVPVAIAKNSNISKNEALSTLKTSFA